MSANTRMTPWTVRLSVQMYQRLLVVYPPSFRRQYGTQMAQAFRDCCREAASTGGTAGLLRYWLIAFGDLIVSALAERRREEVHMSRTSWIRLGSLAAIISGVIPAILSGWVLSEALTQILALQLPLRLEDIPFQVGWAGIAQWALYVPALISLRVRGASRAGSLGWVAITLAILGAFIGGVGVTLFMSDVLYQPSQWYLYSNVIHLGSVILAIGMILYGATTLKYRLLPRCNWLLLAIGVIMLLDVASPYIAPLLDPNKWLIVSMTTSLATAVAWIFLGVVMWPRRNEETGTRDVLASVELAV